MYTVTYIGTTYIYVSKKSFKRQLVPIAIAILYLCNIIKFGAQWYTIKWEAIDNGNTRDSDFLSLYNLPQWYYLTYEIPFVILLILSDALLYFLLLNWSSSYRWACFRPSHKIRQFNISNALAVEFSQLLTAALTVTFGTTFITTILIAYRIYSVSKHEGVSARRFKHIIDIIVQTGAVNSLTLWALALSPLVDGGTPVLTNTRLFAVQHYTENVLPILAIEVSQPNHDVILSMRGARNEGNMVEDAKEMHRT
ncbi:hypothetical protein BDN70DRAFT_983712 [Pholiota conissans]|uniref:Uncharacterized protein n=1 Tax=Pholiota conissans TaxID=109636 RepID=A0A9P5Z4U0_9AGAR|nr:hypothetical protein BDN70DRAFT_983712 [Pholiota conissans]